jgi:hypothetical protein
MINTNWWRHSKFYAKKNPFINSSMVSSILNMNGMVVGFTIFYHFYFLVNVRIMYPSACCQLFFFMKKDHQTFITDKFCLILLSSFKGDF